MDVFFEEKALYQNSGRGESEEDVGEDDFNEIDNRTRVFDDSVRKEEIASESRPNSSSTAKRRKKKTSKVLYVLETKYDIVEQVCREQPGWKECDLEDDFDFLWTDTAIPADRFTKLKPYQRFNHFVGMSAVSRKNNLGRNLIRMKKHFGKEFAFFPDTWILPTDLADFKAQFTGKKNRTFIIKPDNGCQGRGIFLTRDFEQIQFDYSQGLVAQRYIHKPFLLDGFKFDLRIYVLVTGCDPLRIFIHEEGLVRLATTSYVAPSHSNLAKPTMHLTNYAINCRSPNFEENVSPDDIHDGHKRSLKAFYAHMADIGHDVVLLKAKIEDIIIKTLIAVQPSLAHVHHSCQPDDLENAISFEILGLDVLIDQKMNPWLLEVNHAPSFGTDSELDQIVKHKVISDSLRIVNISHHAKKKFKAESRRSREARAMGTAAHQRSSPSSRKTGEHSSSPVNRAKERAQRRQTIADCFASSRCEWEDGPACPLGGFHKIYPSLETEARYLKFHDMAISIWETLTGGQSRKPLRITPLFASDPTTPPRPPVPPKAAAPTAATVLSAPKALLPTDATPPSTRESINQSKAALVRQSSKLAMSASVVAHTARMSKSRSLTGSAAPTVAVGEAEGQVRNTAQPVLPPPALVTMSDRSTALPGSKIRVQTSFGWEEATVLRRHGNGRMDIAFRDGQTMKSVNPRIHGDRFLPPTPPARTQLEPEFSPMPIKALLGRPPAPTQARKVMPLHHSQTMQPDLPPPVLITRLAGVRPNRGGPSLKSALSF